MEELHLVVNLPDCAMSGHPNKMLIEQDEAICDLSMEAK